MFFKNKSEIPFAIKKHNLVDFWNSLSPNEKLKSLKAAEFKLTSGPRGMNLLTSNLNSGSTTASEILGGVGANLLSEKEYDLANHFLKKALEVADDPIAIHFALNSLISESYRLRAEPGNLEQCIAFCKMDIENFNKFNSAWREKYPNLRNMEPPYMPSFHQLAIIYEKQGRIQEAIEICKLAISEKLKDKTKGGFQSRLEKLQKKQSRMNDNSQNNSQNGSGGSADNNE